MFDRVEKFDEWQDASYIYLGTAALHAGTGFEVDDRRLVHDLVWVESGSLLVALGDRITVLTSSRAMWIPSPVAYRLFSHRSSDATVLAFWPDYCPLDWPDPRVVARSGITRDVSTYLATAPRSVVARYHAERLLLASLGAAEPTADVLVPTDDRARRVAEALVANPADDRTLRAWGQAVGASARTLARAFNRDTGLTFPAWRTALRMQVAVARLAVGIPAIDVATEIGYHTPSAFTAAFKRATGVVPSDVSVLAG